MSSTPWFRFYSEALRDPKIAEIADITDQPEYVVMGFWTGLLCLANDSVYRGQLWLTDSKAMSQTRILKQIDANNETGKALFDAFLDLQLIALVDNVYVIYQWDKRQFKSDNSTERSREWRRKQKAAETSGEGGGSHYPKRLNGVEQNDGATLHATIDELPEAEQETESEKNPTTTTRTHMGDDDQFGQVVALLNQRGLYLDGFTSQLVQECYDDINPQGDETKLGWFRYACQESAGKKASWKYFEAIIRGVGESGSLSAHKANRSSKRKDNTRYANNSNDITGLQEQAPATKQVYDPATNTTYAQ